MSVEATCPNCLEPFTARDKRNVYCSQRCGKIARQAQWRTKQSATSVRYRTDPDFREQHKAVAHSPERWERICPECKIRHRIPRVLPRESSVLLVPLDRYQLKTLYALAIEFIDAGGGEDIDYSEACEECGRWSVIAWLDWLSPDVEKSA